MGLNPAEAFGEVPPVISRFLHGEHYHHRGPGNFEWIPGFVEQMGKFYDNPMRDVTPFVYGWYTQDSLRKALFLHNSRVAHYVEALRFRKGFRWATQDMVGFFQAIQQTLHKTIMNMGKEAGPAQITEIVKKGLALESNEGGVGGRSGS